MIRRVASPTMYLGYFTDGYNVNASVVGTHAEHTWAYSAGDGGGARVNTKGGVAGGAGEEGGKLVGGANRGERSLQQESAPLLKRAQPPQPQLQQPSPPRSRVHVSHRFRADEMFVFLGPALVQRIVARRYCHSLQFADCDDKTDLYDTDYGGRLKIPLSNRSLSNRESA